MCTVTVICLNHQRNSAGSMIRLACNRDEKRARLPALSPVVRPFGRRSAVLPVDPESNGTWIAANDAGLVATLLNVYAPGAKTGLRSGDRPRQSSRGTIIPRILHCDGAADAAGLVRELDPGDFFAFRLVVLDGEQIVELRSDGGTMTQDSTSLRGTPFFFTSSGLGDGLVEGPRRTLFDEMFCGSGDLLLKQEQFHRHVWPDRPHLSVFMSRPDARTVSQSVIEVDDQRIRFLYADTASGTPSVFPPAILSRGVPLS